MLNRGGLSRRCGVFAVAALAGGTILSAQPTPQFHAAIDYVELRVRVVDRKGGFVSGLNSADFEVSENAVLQALATLEEVRSGAAPARSSKTRAVVASREDLEQSTYFLLIDDGHLSIDGATKAVEVLTKFIQTQLGSTDKIGLAFTSGAPGQVLTNNHDVALAALNRLHGQFDSRAPAEMKEQRSRAVLDAVGTISRTLAQTATGQRSALVLVTSGVGCVAVPRASDTSVLLCGSALQAAVRGAVASGVTVYAMDPAGTTNPRWKSPAETLDVSGQFIQSGNSNAAPAGADNGFDAMHVLADETGGFAVTGTNRLTDGLDRLVRESARYYRIGYYSSSDLAGTSRPHVLVRVKRPRVAVFHGSQLPGRPPATPSSADTRSSRTPDQTGVPAADASLESVLLKAVAYAASWQAWFGSIVIEEQLTQRTSNARVADAEQQTRADVLLLRPPGQSSYLTFRDVFEVNGRPVRDHDDRLRKLFLDAPSTVVFNAARIANESSRYNIGTTIRTIDVPTFPLTLVSAGVRPRFAFRRRSDESIAGTRTWRIDFTERTRPSLVRTLRNDSVPLEGSFWIEPTLGKVVQALVKTEGTPDPGTRLPPLSGATLMWVRVKYVLDPSVGLLVPERMDEFARAEDGGTVTGAATYSNIRRFDVSTGETLAPR